MALVRYIVLIFVVLFAPFFSVAQKQYELQTNWLFNAAAPTIVGADISKPGTTLGNGWKPAVVPGTVLTSLLHNKSIPDPLYGYNNALIPDINDVGAEYYTYWFVTDFAEKAVADERVWLTFRGVNYKFEAYLNGIRIDNGKTEGMFLRKEIDITNHLSTSGKNRLAVLVYPPLPAGEPNGGQGGDGTIAKNVTNQYVAGWDWIQPIHDRNTGIWDKILIKKAKGARIINPFVKCKVNGARYPAEQQDPASVRATVDIQNGDGKTMNGTMQFELNGRTVSDRISIPSGETISVELPTMSVTNPQLWWPNGMGQQYLYTAKIKLMVDGKGLVDEAPVTFGIREITTRWNNKTNSREVWVNGRRMFVKGANWTLSDAMLRLSAERYDAEVGMHNSMNINMLRVWGGGITERPEFYEACDKYGLLIMQDFWITGDCNGRWYDKLKKDDTTTRRLYPDDHALWLASAADQIKMLRNHPSLAIWCGGNEIKPPADILKQLKDSLIPQLDGTRYLFEYSNADSMSLHAHDGPYTIQPDSFFWTHKSWGFNSEVGSVGIGDLESLKRIMPDKNLILPYYSPAEGKWIIDSMWRYHKYSSYDSSIELYGHPKSVEDFTKKAQVVNFNQYRALIEGARARKWDWYTGTMIWKTQNPWTALVGQMYDVYLDANAGLYGVREAAKPLHVMFHPKWKMVMVANDHPTDTFRVKLWYSITKGYTSIQGINDSVYTIPPDTTMVIATAPDYERQIDKEDTTCGAFMSLRLYQAGTKTILDDNMYWFPGMNGSYDWLSKLKPASLDVVIKKVGKGNYKVTLKNRSDANMSFFNHLSVVDKQTHKRILPVTFSQNFISILPERYKEITIQFAEKPGTTPQLCVDEWNTGKRFIDLR